MGSTALGGHQLFSLNHDHASLRHGLCPVVMAGLPRQIANGGTPLCFEYDALGRMTRKGEGNTAVPCTISNELAAYQYDTAQNGIGQLAQVTWPGGGDTFFYDSLGRMDKQTSNSHFKIGSII
jgi:hypothetical protein